MAQTKEKTQKQGSVEMDVHHLDGCPAERIETYESEGPRGFVVITRCVDCGAHTAAKPTDSPRL